jgi:AraC-like DNA-binding protein/mannose-6-phosphate isomerase-like protein (cupin superfamily)
MDFSLGGQFVTLAENCQGIPFARFTHFLIPHDQVVDCIGLCWKPLQTLQSMLYRNWLNLKIHLLWCHNRHVAKGTQITGPTLRFTEFTNSAAWLVREGWAQVEHDGRSFTARPGQWLIVRPGPRVQTFSQDARMISIAFEARWPDGANLSQDGLSLVIDAADAPALEQKIRPILNAVTKIAPDTWDLRNHQADLGYFLRLEQLLCEWVAVLSETLEARGIRHSGHFDIDERVRTALDLLHARDLALPLALDQLASAVHISPNHLIRLFRKDLQTTPRQFWDRLRIEHAQSCLRQPDMRIKEVAIDLGFKHLSHFSKWFKRHAGRSAQSFRE